MALLQQGLRDAEGIFAARSRGDSMEPQISGGTWWLFHPVFVGTRQDHIVLVEDQSKISGDRYTLKKYHSRKMYSSDGTWVHEETFLLPLNPWHSPLIANLRIET